MTTWLVDQKSNKAELWVCYSLSLSTSEFYKARQGCTSYGPSSDCDAPLIPRKSSQRRDIKKHNTTITMTLLMQYMYLIKHYKQLKSQTEQVRSGVHVDKINN